VNEANMGFNKFCGPAALSILTGRNTDDCAMAITFVNGRYKVQGVTVGDLIAAGDRLGLNFTRQDVMTGHPLFFAASLLCKTDGMYLVMVPKHFIVLEVKGGVIHLCDNHTKTPINLQNSARLGQKVEGVYIVTEKPAPPIVTVVSSTFEAEKRVGGSVHIKQINRLSDGGVKILVVGKIELADDVQLQEIAFAIMEVTKKEVM
jgi:hypothetical protein